MTATYTFDVFSSLDGYGAASGNWAGYWGKQGPELLDHRLALYGAEQRMVFGANTYRAFVQMLASSTEESDVRDPWVTRMVNMPATVVSTTLEAPLDWPDATVVSGDAVDVVARLKEESEVPLRSHGSLSLNRALMAAGLVDYVQVTLFPVITGQTGLDPIFQGAADFDLELVEHRTATSKSSPTGPPCMSESNHAPHRQETDPTRKPRRFAALTLSASDKLRLGPRHLANFARYLI
jgi:dihydrofolate reductase